MQMFRGKNVLIKKKKVLLVDGLTSSPAVIPSLSTGYCNFLGVL